MVSCHFPTTILSRASLLLLPPSATKIHLLTARPRYKGGVDGFLEQSAKTFQKQGSKINILHSGFDPVAIKVNGNRATSEAFCLITSGLTLDGVDYELASYMRLVTRLERLQGQGDEGGEWRMLSLESIYVRDRLVTSFPGSGPGTLVMSDEVRAYPKAYRHLALVMRHRGLNPRPDLPHEEDQQGVRQLLDRNRAFLEGADVDATMNGCEDSG